MRATITHEELATSLGPDVVARVEDGHLPATLTHEPTRRFLVETGLPREGALMRLDVAAAHPVADVYPGGGLDESVARLLVIGEFTYSEGLARILLDGAGGEVHVGWTFESRPDLCEPELLAGDLSTLAVLLAAVGRMLSGTGEFAAFADRRGPEVATEVSGLLLDVLRENEPALAEPGEGISGFWRAVVHAWPLRYAARPGTAGLRLDVGKAVVDEEFDHDDVTTVTVDGMPPALAHEPTRDLLRDIGLICSGPVVPEDDRPLPVLADTDDDPPEDGAHLVVLGYLYEDTDLVVDGRTGRLLAWYTPDSTLSVLNADVSTMVFTQWMVSRTRQLDREFGITDDYDGLSAVLGAVLAELDPEACAHEHSYWPMMFEDQAGGGLYGT